MRLDRKILLGVLVWFTTCGLAVAQTLDGRTIVSEIEKRLWGSTSQGRYEMVITTPYWQRTLKLKVWMERPDKSFIRILSPSKEAGVGSLRIKDEMWNYLPKVERTVKVPPSLMLQAWMGSNFTNDDLVKESSMINDYTHELATEDNINGEQVYRVKSTPKSNAPVVWGKLIYLVRQSDLMPLSFDYYDERGRLIKSLTFSEVREMDGRQVPTLWEMRPTDKPENSTVIRLSEVIFDRPISEKIFTLRNLRGR
ncbi:MAG: outer membrane lipoprotein-sorting protein [Gammaproteobacteria bacterium]|nr:outer membrane lipoprotein-sorting protein [Gammaproteobacteria bacterium]